MPEIEIRRVQGDEAAEAWIPLGAYAFGETPPLWGHEEWERFVQHYTDPLQLILFEDGKPVASTARNCMTQNVRGTLYPAGGIWGVAVHPAGRRKGYARRLVVEMLAAMRAEGNALSMLYPFRESFYARVGYTRFPQPRMASFAPQPLLPLLSKELDGAVELVEIKDGAERFMDYLEAYQRWHHGFGLFSREQTVGDLRGENKAWLALAQIDGNVVGAMTYENKGDPRRMLVRNFYYDDYRGRYLLLEWCARHIDQIQEIEVRLAPEEQPDLWLEDLNPQFRAGFAPMGRVLDVTRLGGMEVGPGNITLRIRDEQCPWNEGCFRFTSLEGRLHVEAVGAVEPECELTSQGLAALIFGTHAPETFALRGWGRVPRATQATLCSMFPRMQPYLHSMF